jgi:hypothetical protein
MYRQMDLGTDTTVRQRADTITSARAATKDAQLADADIRYTRVGPGGQ